MSLISIYNRKIIVHSPPGASVHCKLWSNISSCSMKQNKFLMVELKYRSIKLLIIGLTGRNCLFSRAAEWIIMNNRLIHALLTCVWFPLCVYLIDKLLFKVLKDAIIYIMRHTATVQGVSIILTLFAHTVSQSFTFVPVQSSIKIWEYKMFRHVHSPECKRQIIIRS